MTTTVSNDNIKFMPPSPKKMNNKLGLEKSPYLLQHKNNPVWWQSWDKESFKFAKEQNKPIFLSIGYSTCHWCHVMEKESFEDKVVAETLNRSFIPIKVDREERPDVDKIYMDAIHAMGMHGGWPLSMFLTPDLKPFFGGTYFPKENFLKILNQISQKWATSSDLIIDQASDFHEVLKTRDRHKSSDLPDENTFKSFYMSCKDAFDPIYGGFSHAPKFPPSMTIRMLLRLAKRDRNSNSSSIIYELVDKTLKGMFKGGIYDHLGGGFHRYSTDEMWLIPHFEKMLYDNALIAIAYIEAYQLMNDEIFAEIAKETLDYILRDMSCPDGGYFSAEDADSEGEEGLFYTWTLDELKEVLTKEEFLKISSIYEMTENGNLGGRRNIPNLIANKDPRIVFNQEIKKIRKKLFHIRDKRLRPHKDDKIITGWNGLMISAMAKAYQIFNEDKYLISAQKCADFIQNHLDEDNFLKRRFRDGDTRFDAYLDDYAYLIQGLIDLYESDFNDKWLKWALDLQSRQDKELWSNSDSAYKFAKGSSQLIKDNIDFHDSAIPNSNALSMLNLLKLHYFTYNAKYLEKAEEIMRAHSKMILQYPSAFAQSIIALDFMLDSSIEISVLGDPDHEITKDMLKVIRKSFIPNKVIAIAKAGASVPEMELLKSKEIINNLPTAYVCINRSCKEPTNSPEELKKSIFQHKTISL